MATIKVENLERELRPEPFTVGLSDGTEIEFADPQQMHWETVVQLDAMDPLTRIRTLTGEEGFAALRADTTINADMLNKIMAAWRAHFGVGGAGEAPSSPGS